MPYQAPPYVFQEYPKWVYPETGEPLVVLDAQEESLALGQARKRRGRKANDTQRSDTPSTQAS